MRYLSLLIGLFVALTGSCLAQRAPVWTEFGTRDELTFLTQLLNASWTQNANAYAALFASNGRWDGPFGQNAIGPLNIRTAVGQFFTEFGPLREVKITTVELSPDVVMADVYQMTKDRHASLDPKLIAPGSGEPPRFADVRTTLILCKQQSGWNILAARVADLRTGTARVTTR